MSQAKHTGYRKVLEIINTEYKGLPVKLVYWCLVSSTTSRTIKTDHIGVSCYVDNKLANYGISAWSPRKAVSINLKNPLQSKFFSTVSTKSVQNESFSRAYGRYCESLGQVSGTVLCYDNNRGEGLVKCEVTGSTLPVYGCNIVGAKTGYGSTACMNLERGQTVTFKHHSRCGACNVIGGTFDAVKWGSLDKSKLAFIKSQDGSFENGLFAK